MASETLSFDIVGRDAGAGSAFKRVGDTATLAARGARTCAIALEQQRKAADASVGATLTLARADKILADAERNLSGEAAKADAALRRAAGGGAGTGGGRGGFASRIAGGAGPGILGLSPKLLSIIGGGAAGLAAVPAGAAALGVLGFAGAGARELIGTKQKPGELFKPFEQAARAFSATMKAVVQPLAGPLRQVLGQIPQFLKQISPELKAAFGAVGPLIGPLVHGFEALVKGILPGLVALFKAARPAITAVAQLLGTVGKDLGGVFKSFAPVMKQSALIFKALGDVVAGLLPVVGKLAAIFAKALAPVFVTLAGVIRTLEPVLVIIGKIIAGLAQAVLGDLVSAFGAVGTLIKALSPSFKILAGVLGSVFKTLENTGVFAILASTLEALAKPLASLVNALVRGLAPVLPPIIRLVNQVGGIIVQVLASAVKAVIPLLIVLIKAILQPLVPLIKALAPLIGLIAKGLGLLLVGAIKLVTPLLTLVIKAIGYLSDGLTTVIKWIIGLAKNWKSAWDDIKSVVGTVVGGIRRLFAGWLDFTLGIFADVIHGLAHLFGGLPFGIGSALKKASAEFDKFRAHVVSTIAGTHPPPIKIPFVAVLPTGKRITAYAAGTAGAAAGWAMVGEQGPELVYMRGGEHVLPNRMVRGYAAGTFGVTPQFPSLGVLAAAFTSFAHVVGEKIAHSIAIHLPRVFAGSGSAAAAQRIAAALLPRYGWGPGQFPPLAALWNRESGWNRFAQNPSSGAFGIPQALPYTKMPRAAWPTWAGGSASALAQIVWGLGYIKTRPGYGSPAAAWAHEVNYGWYDHGGWLRPGLTMAYNGTGRPERVGGGEAVVIQVGHGGGGRNSLDALLMQWLRHNVRVKGGGDVQVAFSGSG